MTRSSTGSLREAQQLWRSDGVVVASGRLLWKPLWTRPLPSHARH